MMPQKPRLRLRHPHPEARPLAPKSRGARRRQRRPARGKQGPRGKQGARVGGRRLLGSHLAGCGFFALFTLLSLGLGGGFGAFGLSLGSGSLLGNLLGCGRSLLSCDLVNLEMVSRYVSADGGYLLLHNGSTVPVSNRKKELLISHLKRL